MLLIEQNSGKRQQQDASLPSGYNWLLAGLQRALRNKRVPVRASYCKYCKGFSVRELLFLNFCLSLFWFSLKFIQFMFYYPAKSHE